MQTRVLLFLLTLLFSSFNLHSFGQIFQPEGLNIPGEWNSWTNPPAPGPFLSSSQSGGLVNLITVGERRWTTTFQSDYSGSRQFLFTSGPSSNAYSNKWGGTTISLNSIQNVFYQSASNNSVSLVNGRFYTINWSDIGYQNTSACVMETSATPVGVSSVVQSPVTNSVYPGNNVLVTASLSASPSTEEKFYVRYTVDGWSTSSVVLMTVSGNSATASIPGQNAGILVSYYVFSSTLTLTSGQSNLTYDLATIRRSSYSNGQNESFTVQNCPNPTFTTVPTSTSCFGESLLYQTQSGMSNYSWSFSGTLGTDFTISSGGNSGSNSASIVWLTQGSKTVTVNYLNALGCTSSNTASNTTSIQAIDFANIQFPQSAAICQGSTAVFYGQLYEPGLTDATAQYGGPIGVVVQFGISSSNTNPATWPVGSWQSTQFNFNGSGGNNDEFMITTGSTLSPGTYYYAFRYSLNGCGYQYGGWSGTNGGFWNGSSNVNGVFTINPSSNYFADTDGDGYGAGSATNACSQPAGYVTNNTDCNDASSSVNPGATEVCNGVDDDCDATADDGLTFTNYYADSDGDGYGAGSATNACSQPAGYVTNNTDCNNSNSSVYPGATEVCNGVDDDCDASTDEGVQNTYYLDADADGYGTTATSATACTAPNGYVANNTDCDDSNSTTYTGAAELCNGADDDCDGSNDEDLIFTNYYVDLDGDGYGAGTATNACTQPAGMVASSTDCDDTDQDVNPGSSEICNAIDDDCDFSTDEGLPVSNYFIDADGDSFGSGSSIGFCSNPGAGYANVGGDCDDSNDAINPDVSELCNNVDDDCNSQTDEGLTFSDYYADSDGDGFGAGLAVSFCSNPGASYVQNNTDCNNGNASIYPGATESCNGIDDDCDGNSDEGSLNTYYIDADGDGFGGSNAVQACSQPAGYIAIGGDCFDFGAAINPNANEICANSIDDNCDGTIDNATLNYFPDTDGDGFGGGNAVAIQSCSPPAGYYTTSTDCNNNNNTVYPGAIELCNSIDEDCDGQIDEGTQSLFYADADGDGFGGATTIWACTQPAGYTNSSTDCNDNSSAANPAATELCNGNDDDCDGQIDEGCPTTIAGEEPSNAVAAPSSYFSYCSNFYGTLANAYPSNNALSSCITGEDKWYSFIALTSAVTISISGVSNDILIELQNFTGNLIDVENTVSGIGSEVMNVTGLVPGTQYRVGIRNYNSGLAGGGTFTGCIRHLKAGNCDSGNSSNWPGTLNRCNIFKSAWVTSGVQYRFTFTGISGIATGNVYTRTQSSDYLNLNNLVPTIPSGCIYNVIVTNIYTLANGAGVPETIEVSQVNPTTITITSDALTQLRDTDRCSSGPRFRNAIVASLPWVCGVSNWRWRFTEVDNSLQPVGLTFEVNRGAASNYLNLGTVSQIQYGKTYAVQTAPIFTYTGSNYIWGPVQYICIIGQTGMILNDSNPSAALNTKDLVLADEIQLNVYPNPSNGQNTYLTVSGIEDDNAKISVFNQVGQLVLQFAMSCESSGTQMELPVNQFVNGLYFIEMYANGKKHHTRMLIQE